MSVKLATIIIVLGLIVLGFVNKLFIIMHLYRRVEYTHKYRENFIQFGNEIQKTGRLDNPQYYELLRDVNKIQRELGLDGIISYYRDPAAGIQMRDYPIMLNFFNELRMYLNDRHLFSERIYLLISGCDEAMVKHIGSLTEAIELGKKRIVNPFFLFLEWYSMDFGTTCSDFRMVWYH